MISYANREAFIERLGRSEEHTSELQSLTNIVCRLLLEKKRRPLIPGRAQCRHVGHAGGNPEVCSLLWPGRRRHAAGCRGASHLRFFLKGGPPASLFFFPPLVAFQP